jgi:hypothetical protein
MPSFQVTSNELTAAGAIVSADDTDLSTGQSAMSGAGDALTGTPAQANYSFFVGTVDAIVGDLHTTVASLGSALREAAAARGRA